MGCTQPSGFHPISEHGFRTRKVRRAFARPAFARRRRLAARRARDRRRAQAARKVGGRQLDEGRAASATAL
eukprot:350203-Chlamydomonas_euryale.AAC.3